jgi:hypothetical protein
MRTEKQPMESAVTMKDGQKSCTFLSVRGMVMIAIFAAMWELFKALFRSDDALSVTCFLLAAACYAGAAVLASRFKPVYDIRQWAVHIGMLGMGSLFRLIEAYSDGDMASAVFAAVFVTGFGGLSWVIYLERKR